jgi:Lrp/AsnC family transcriptional regulator, leucine-responsive regulatory protein
MPQCGNQTFLNYQTILSGFKIEIMKNEISLTPALTSELDRFDRAILQVLAEDGRISLTDLAARIGLSKTPTQKRFKRLIDQGVILGFRAVIDPVCLDIDHVSFAEVKLSDTREQALRDFNCAVRQIAEVEECHMIASSFDYLLKVRTSDIRRYRFVLGEKISSLPHVASTSTFVAMETIRDATR